jgi:hypothetical protein
MAGALSSPERPPNGCFKYKVLLHLSIFIRTQTKPPPDMQLKHRMPAPPRASYGYFVVPKKVSGDGDGDGSSHQSPKPRARFARGSPVALVLDSA